jgi:gas vesicle protein
MKEKSSIGRKVRIGVLIAAVAAVMMCTACGKTTQKDTDKSSTETTQTKKSSGSSTSTEKKDDDTVKDAYAAYSDILEKNENDISAYTWQDTDSGSIEPVAFYDINGDGVPELFFMEAVKSEPSAALTIYTYENGEAKEVKYSFFDESTRTEDGKFADVNAGSGTTYVVYMSGSNLVMQSKLSDDGSVYCLQKFSVSGDLGSDGLSSAGTAKDEYYMSDSGKMRDKYYINGKKVKSSRGSSMFSSTQKSASSVIMYSKQDTEGFSIWKTSAMNDPLQMSYGDALDYAAEKSGK